MDSQSQEMAGKIRRVINGFMFLEKRSVFQEGALQLYPSEIHLMQVVNEGPDLNAGQMARKLGISNGAVSQTLARLEKKGAIHRTRDPALKNKVTVTFTESGRRAFDGFEKKQTSAQKAFSDYLTGLSPTDRRVVNGFISHLEELLKGLR